jgi:signal transduction histidine kinase
MKSQANHNKKPSQLFEKLIRALPGVFSSKATIKTAPVKRSHSNLPKLKAGANNSGNLSDSTWVKAVASSLASGQTNLLRAQTKIAPNEALERETVDELLFLFSCLEELSVEFNKQIETIEPLKAMRVTSARLIERGKKSEKTPKDKYVRCRVTAGPQSLILRGADGVIEIFQVDSNKVFLPSETEIRKNLKGTFELSSSGKEGVWYFDSLPTGKSDQLSFLRKLFRDFLKSAKKACDEKAKTGPVIWTDSSQKEQSIEELVLTKQMLIQKLVIRHEELTNAIARDLHDVVIADIMLLRRKLTVESEANQDEVLKVLDRLTARLREICYDLTPRDLEDWGLATVLVDLLDRAGKQIGAHCNFTGTPELPALSESVQLQIYRIVQESLNNVAKYSKAKNISVTIENLAGLLRITVKDDGVGFETGVKSARNIMEGGAGLASLNERADLIRCFHPTKLQVISEPGGGTKVLLEIATFES